MRDRISDFASDVLGVTVQPTGRVRALEEAGREFTQFASQASELAYGTLDYFNARPQEIRPERRQRLAQRSRVAFISDPLAGREVEMLADFAFGKGIGRPKCSDPDVQDVVDAAWTDPSNVEQITGFGAQRAASNDLKTQANLLAVMFEGGGEVRVGWLNFDDVIDVVPDPENRRRPLYYLARERKYRWNVKTNSPAFDESTTFGMMGLPVLKYYPHWQNLELAEQERENNPDLEPLPEIKPEQLGAGKVYPVSINRLGEQHFGIPPFARSLRFYSAMNQFTEARVTMAQAASAFVAKRVVRGTPGMVRRQAESVLNQAGELSSRDVLSGSGEFGRMAEERRMWGARQAPMPPGSIWNESESDTLQSLSLNSGAAQAAQDATIIRAPISASSGFGQHYLGDASNANLATATTLELPVLMLVQTWQQYFEELYTWFVDRVIEAAVNSGKLGGTIANADALAEGQRGLGELRLSETADKQQAEKITGKDLRFTFEMPKPGRRALPDVTTYVVQTLVAFDPMGTNLALRRGLLAFSATEGLQIDDVQGFVDEVYPPNKPLEPLPDAGDSPLDTTLLPGAGRLRKDLTQPPMPQKGGKGGEGKSSEAKPASTGTGAKQSSTPADKVKGSGAMQAAEWLPDDLRGPVDRYVGASGDLFAALVAQPAIAAALQIEPPAEAAESGKALVTR